MSTLERSVVRGTHRVVWLAVIPLVVGLAGLLQLLAARSPEPLVFVPIVTPAAPPAVEQPQPADEDRRPPIDLQACRWAGDPLPADTRVIAVGGYGARPLDFQIDRTGHEANLVELDISTPGPVALLVGAYEPMIWRVRWSPQTQIVAAVGLGYHRPVFAGLASATPTLLYAEDAESRVAGQATGCSWFDDVEQHAHRIAALSAQLFGRGVDRVVPVGETGRVHVGPPGARLITFEDVTVESFRDPARPPVGRAGISATLAAGTLREPTETEREHLLARLRAHRCFTSVELLRYLPTYVVANGFELPAGMFGAHAVALIVPRGVARPTGNAGHATIIDPDRVCDEW